MAERAHHTPKDILGKWAHVRVKLELDTQLITRNGRVISTHINTVDTTKYEDACDFLADESRPGRWDVYSDHLGLIDFYISNPDVAFEFKMRWG